MLEDSQKAATKEALRNGFCHAGFTLVTETALLHEKNESLSPMPVQLPMLALYESVCRQVLSMDVV